MVPGRRAVVQAIGQVLEHGRHGLGIGVVRQPDPRREPRAVGERDEDSLPHDDGSREFGAHADSHQTSLISIPSASKETYPARRIDSGSGASYDHAASGTPGTDQ